jgi:hypothetical protein
MTEVRRLALTLMLATLGVAGCGDDDKDGGGPATTPQSKSEKVLIQTRLSIPTGEVLSGSSIGDSPFCTGGTFRDQDGNEQIGSVDRTFRCPDGSLRIGFSPGEPQGQTQSGPWKVLGGTGSFKGLRGSGTMRVTFVSDSSKNGRETFTGTAVP